MDFNDILEMVVEKKASDLFITADIPPSIKVHGRVMPVSKTRLDASQSRELTLGLMTPEQRDEFLHTKECNFAFSAKNIGRFRVSAFVQRDCVGMVLRRIETRIPSFEELGLPPMLHELAMANRGIVFFVGATGTGKSTSLAAMVGYRNQNSTGHIISIEDPIELLHSHAGCIVTQREVGIDTESYEVALRNTLRQAPDVILIGEIRTREAMEHAISFAETGHPKDITLLFTAGLGDGVDAGRLLEGVGERVPAEAHRAGVGDGSKGRIAVAAHLVVGDGGCRLGRRHGGRLQRVIGCAAAAKSSGAPGLRRRPAARPHAGPAPRRTGTARWRWTR